MDITYVIRVGEWRSRSSITLTTVGFRAIYNSNRTMNTVTTTLPSHIELVVTNSYNKATVSWRTTYSNSRSNTIDSLPISTRRIQPYISYPILPDDLLHSRVDRFDGRMDVASIQLGNSVARRRSTRRGSRGLCAPRIDGACRRRHTLQPWSLAHVHQSTLGGHQFILTIDTARSIECLCIQYAGRSDAQVGSGIVAASTLTTMTTTTSTLSHLC